MHKVNTLAPIIFLCTLFACIHQFLTHDVLKILKWSLKDFCTFLCFYIALNVLYETFLTLTGIHKIWRDPDQAGELLVVLLGANTFFRGNFILKINNGSF